MPTTALSNWTHFGVVKTHTSQRARCAGHPATKEMLVDALKDSETSAEIHDGLTSSLGAQRRSCADTRPSAHSGRIHEPK
jgi:hypothetical protein